LRAFRHTGFSSKWVGAALPSAQLEFNTDVGTSQCAEFRNYRRRRHPHSARSQRLASTSESGEAYLRACKLPGRRGVAGAEIAATCSNRMGLRRFRHNAAFQAHCSRSKISFSFDGGAELGLSSAIHDVRPLIQGRMISVRRDLQLMIVNVMPSSLSI